MESDRTALAYEKESCKKWARSPKQLNIEPIEPIISHKHSLILPDARCILDMFRDDEMHAAEID